MDLLLNEIFKTLMTAAATVLALRFLLDRLLAVHTKFRVAKEERALKESDEPETHSPTANAELILHLLLKPDEAEVLGGDLQERYLRKNQQFGQRRARIWLWSQVLRSIWPLLKRFFAAGGFLAAAEFIRKLLS